MTAFSLTSFAEFDALLSQARAEVDDMLLAEPFDGPIESVHTQLAALHEWTRANRCPTSDEKARLNFGQIASRELDVYPVADALYALASFVTYWGEPDGPAVA